MRSIPIILCVDIEPGARLLSHADPDPWAGYESMHRYLNALRPQLEAATGAPCRFNWFFRCDPQIEDVYASATWGIERHPDRVAHNRDRGDAYGVHVHAYRWLEAEREWLTDHGDEEWVAHCVRCALDAYEHALGERCRLFRFGDHWMSTATVNLLEELGVRYDLTVEPGLPPTTALPAGERGTGTAPDYRRVPRVPYAPRRDDCLRAQEDGRRSIRMVPLTSGYERKRRRVRAYRHRIRDHGFAHRNQVTPLSMWRDWVTPNTFEAMLDRALAAQTTPYLAMAIRTDSPEYEQVYAAVDRCLTSLLHYVERGPFEFLTVPEAMRRVGA